MTVQNLAKRSVWATLLCILALGPVAHAQDSQLEEITDRGTVRVGVAEFRPFVFKNTETGELEGLEIEVANRLAEALDVELKLVEATWDTIFAGLHTGKYDVVMSGSKRTLQRALAVSFTEPYVSLTEFALVRADSGIESWSDIDQEGNKVCSVLGGAAHLTITEQRPGVIQNADVRPFKDLSLCGNAVAQGQVTAWVEDVASITTFQRNKPDMDFMTIELPFATHGVGNGYAVAKGNQEFLNWLNIFIQKMKNNGTYTELVEKYKLPKGILVKGWGQK